MFANRAAPQNDHQPPAGANVVLEVRALVKRFGGLVAVDRVDLSIQRGAIVSVIGPNGSGKTTLFNVITGIYRCDAGQVLLDGQYITALAPHAIALRGLARTFQTIRLFNNLSVLDNVLVGAHGALKTSLPAALFRPATLQRREVVARERAIESLSIFGQRLLPRLDQPAFSLSYANRRRLEIARALASQPRVLLLDEPTAGMNPAETAELVQQIHDIRSREHTIVVIEHKLNVVNSISDRVVVLDHGAKLAEGTPKEIGSDERVIEAYLGQDAAP